MSAATADEMDRARSKKYEKGPALMWDQLHPQDGRSRDFPQGLEYVQLVVTGETVRLVDVKGPWCLVAWPNNRQEYYEKRHLKVIPQGQAELGFMVAQKTVAKRYKLDYQDMIMFCPRDPDELLEYCARGRDRRDHQRRVSEIDAYDRDDRVQELQRKAAARFERSGLARGWTTWAAEAVRARRLRVRVQEAAARIFRPRLYRGMLQWKETYLLEEAEQDRYEAERIALEAQQQGASASTIRGRLAGLRSRRQSEQAKRAAAEAAARREADLERLRTILEPYARASPAPSPTKRSGSKQGLNAAAAADSTPPPLRTRKSTAAASAGVVLEVPDAELLSLTTQAELLTGQRAPPDRQARREYLAQLYAQARRAKLQAASGEATTVTEKQKRKGIRRFLPERRRTKRTAEEKAAAKAAKEEATAAKKEEKAAAKLERRASKAAAKEEKAAAKVAKQEAKAAAKLEKSESKAALNRSGGGGGGGSRRRVQPG